MIQLAPADRVLVRMPSWLGDFVMAEPFLRALVAARGPAGRAAQGLTLAGPARFLELLGDRFAGAARLATDGDGDPASWRGHDVAVFLDGSLRSVWSALRAGVPGRIGWARGGRGPLLTHAVRPALERGGRPVGIGRPGRWPRILARPFSTACHELASAMGLAVHDPRPRLDPTAAARATVRRRLGEMGVGPDRPFVLVNAGARPDSAKAYPPGAWAQVLDRLELGLGVLVVGGPGEDERVRATVTATGRARVHGLDPAPGLPELAAWCAAARLVLTADGGARHVAAAVGTPRVVVFGPTDPRHTSDVWDDEAQVRIEVECGPCHRERCPLPGGAHHRCMTGIEPEAVARAARALVGG